MALDNLLAHRQPEPDSLVLLARVQSLEYGKAALPMLFRDTNPVICYSEFPLVARFRGTHPHMRAPVRVSVLSRGKRLVGIVSLGDLAVETGNRDLGGETLEHISEPSVPNR
jgi:hypothetical protein